MNIETISKELAALNDKIKDEKDLGEVAKRELLKACDAFETAMMAALADFRNAIPAYLDGRGEALGALMVAPVKPGIAKAE